MQTRRTRALLAFPVAALAASAVTAQAAPTRYSFAVGAGEYAHMWVASKSTQDGGPCTIVADEYAASQAPLTNQIDSVVLDARKLPLVNGRVNVNWGAEPATKKQLLVRFVREVGCAATAVYGLNGAQSLVVPAGSRYMVVSATEGTVQPWFTIG